MPDNTRSPSKTANRLLWTAQVVLALVFLFAGAMKFILPAEKMQGPVALPLAFIRFIGTAECLGALGLILPGLLRIKPLLTAWAAAGLSIIMIGATTVTVIGMGVAPAIFPFVVGIIAVSIVYGRVRVAPFDSRDRRALATA
jgi:uncharacterized membrane protein YphA (DoxX/SURF4 family)